jgi:hypothetical protein
MGLYDDDKAAVTSGDVQDVGYWQAKFNAEKLEAALKTRQPEAAVKSIVPGVIQLCDSVLKDYPIHADVKKWKQRAEDIQKKISPNPEPADFTGTFGQWKDYSYEAGWRSYHIAKLAAAAQDWSVCKSHASEAVTQFGRSVDRMANWPADVQTWIKSAKAEAEQLQAEADKKR